MRKSLIASLIALAFCTASQALCTWTDIPYCSADGLCYRKGTSGCENLSCEFEPRPGGQITIRDSDGLYSSFGNYDMSKTANDNCTEVYTYE